MPEGESAPGAGLAGHVMSGGQGMACDNTVCPEKEEKLMAAGVQVSWLRLDCEGWHMPGEGVESRFCNE